MFKTFLFLLGAATLVGLALTLVGFVATFFVRAVRSLRVRIIKVRRLRRTLHSLKITLAKKQDELQLLKGGK